MKKGLLKKIASIALVSVMAVSVLGCTNKSGTAVSDDLSKIKANKKIVVGLSPDYAPFEFKDKQGNIIGMDVEIIKEVAKDLGVEYEIKGMDFDGLIKSLEANKIDVILSGMNPNPEREKSVTFSRGYYDSVSQLVVRKGDAGKYKTVADLAGKTIAVQKGTVQETQANTAKAGTVKALGKTSDCILALQGKKVDAVLLDQPVAMFNAKANADLELAEVQIKDTTTKPFAAAMRKNETKLQEAINKTLDRLEKEGKLKSFFNDAVNKVGSL